jgi:hypothetical protein
MALTAQAFRRGWPLTDEIRELVVSAMAGVLVGAESDREKIAAAKVLVAADAVNCKREAIEAAREIHADAGPQTVTVIQCDDWYGNPAPPRLGAPAADPPAPEPVQGDCLRPPLGENRPGPDGHDPGARARARGAKGRHRRR